MIFGIVFGALGVGAIVLFIVGRRPGARKRITAQWIAKREAPITAALESEVDAALWRVRAGLLLGGLAGIVIALPVVASFDPTQDWSLPLNSAAMMMPAMLALAGGGIAGLVTAYPQVRGPVRVASPTAPMLTDFVNAFAVFAVRLQVAILVVGGLAATQYSRWTGRDFGPIQWVLLWGAIIVVPVVWILTELVTRRLLAAPQPSGDAVTLFWRETLRADLLRQIWWLPAVLGYLVPSVISSSLPWSYGTPAQGIGPRVTFWFSMVTLALSVTAQCLLVLEPKSRRRATLLREVQLETA